MKWVLQTYKYIVQLKMQRGRVECRDITPTYVLKKEQQKAEGCRDVTPTNVLYNQKWGVTGRGKTAEMSQLQMYCAIKKRQNKKGGRGRGGGGWRGGTAEKN